MLTETVFGDYDSERLKLVRQQYGADQYPTVVSPREREKVRQPTHISRSGSAKAEIRTRRCFSCSSKRPNHGRWIPMEEGRLTSSRTLKWVSPARDFSVRKRVETDHILWEFPHMKTLTVDDRQRVRLPQARAGQVFAYEPNSDGTIKLVPVIPKPGPRRIVAKMVKWKEGLFFQVPTGYTLDPEAIGKAVGEERES